MEHFKLPYDTESIIDLLTITVKGEVAKRGGQLILTDGLKDSIKKVSNWLSGGSKCGILLCGMVGNGKTTMAKAVISLINRCDIYYTGEKSFRPFVAKMVNARDLVKISEDVARQDYWQADMLVIDDLGDEPAEVMSYGNVQSPIIELLYYRYDRMLPTVVTTNLNMREQQVRKKYGDRIADRFNEMFTPIVFVDNSFRK